MCQAWHDCIHNNPHWLPKNSPVNERLWQVKIYVMENDIEALLKKVENDFPDRDTISPDDIIKLKKEGTYGDTYQTRGIIRDLPVFMYAAKKRQTYPMSWLSGDETDFNQWKVKARNIFKSTWQTLPENIPYDPVLLDKQDRGSYIAEKIVLNITADSRILSYLLKPKGEGPFPAVLLLHDHSAIFDNGKEKVIKPWGISNERIASAKALVNKSYGNRFIGDELAKRGYVCFAIDALNWGDRGGGGMEGQQAIGSNMIHLGMSFAGLIAYEDLRSASFLASLPYVDKDRVAAMGLSMGAYRTWQIAAMSDIIKAGVAICWMATNEGLTSYFNNQTKGNSAFSMLHPGLFRYLDYPDVASMACPKPMLFFNGEKDKLFPIPAVKAAYSKMHRVWESQNVSDKLVTKFWPVPHEFNLEMQEEAFTWLDKQLDRKSENQGNLK
jgi:dienelactone hydrolase